MTKNSSSSNNTVVTSTEVTFEKGKVIEYSV